MIIHKIELSGFRGFKQVTIDLHPKLNILIGSNGAGKTSILDACSMVLNHFIGRIKSDGGKYNVEHWFTSDDVNYEMKESKVVLHFKIDEKIYEYELSKNIFESGYKFKGESFSSYLDSIRQKLDRSTNLPVILYLNASKDFGVPVEINNQTITEYNKHIPQLDAYSEACNKKFYSFKNFTLWWRIEEDKENEKRLRINSSFRSKELETIRCAQDIFVKKLMGDHFENLFITRFNPDENQNFTVSKEGELFIKKANGYIKVSQLSDGEKNILLIVNDIARRLVIANPSAENPHISGTGIVLIDEIDQHLHPAWQRSIIEALKNTFPNIQFIATTHSPLVLSTVKDENIVLIDNFEILSVPEETYGRDSNEILEYVYGIPDSPFKNEIEEIYKLISFKKIKDAREKRDILVDKIGTDYFEVKRIDQILGLN